MTVRIDSPDGDYVIEDVEKEFVDNYNESYGQNLAKVLPSGWRLICYALLAAFLLLLGIYMGNLLNQKKLNQLNSELLTAEREARELQAKTSRRLALANRFAEELRLRTGYFPPFKDASNRKEMAKYTMFKELIHVTKDLENQPKYKGTVNMYFKQVVADRLYGE